MRKLIIILTIGMFFLLGIKLGGSWSVGSSNLFEYSKEQFEKSIIDPNNNYQPTELVPNPNLVNKVANKIDDIMQKIIDKFKDFL